MRSAFLAASLRRAASAASSAFTCRHHSLAGPERGRLDGGLHAEVAINIRCRLSELVATDRVTNKAPRFSLIRQKPTAVQSTMHIGSRLPDLCADSYRLSCQEEVLNAKQECAECARANRLKQRLLQGKVP